jgi:23S rRNA (guanosine2251-2'-O)-methyltransferase
LKHYSSTGNKKGLITGRQPVMEAIEAGSMIDRIFIQKGAGGEIVQLLIKLAHKKNIPINLVPVEKLNSLSRGNHQGIVAIAGLVSYSGLQDVIDEVNRNEETPLFLMLDGVTDVRNIGGISRSAVCCGSQALIIPEKGVGALNEEAMKSSAGALQKIHVCREASLLKAVDSLHLNDIKVYTSEMNAGKKVYELDFCNPCCIILGNEEKGVQSYLSKSADDHFTIPMSGNFNSFNVSVAAGIILYEAMKQRFGSQT